MNVAVDGLAKQALIAAVTGNEYIDNSFPLEKVRVSIRG